LVVRERVMLDFRCFFAALAGFLDATRGFRAEAFGFLDTARAFFVAGRRAVVFFFTAFLDRVDFAREVRFLVLEVALERVLLAALRDRALFLGAFLVVNNPPSSRAHSRGEPMSRGRLYQPSRGAAKRFRCHPSCTARGITVKRHQRLKIIHSPSRCDILASVFVF
jgi:hypothetical protein